ncbi:MAG TPA: threonine/serine exporter family protein [Mycobacteriales bacterium]|jgi:uncharacterized membrane protein YjjP (DUF1212 family)|nr:threonine/serine exporter family protein [Mycobacteriales bacterium]
MRNRLRRTPGPRQQVGTALREHARRAVRSGGPPTIAFAAVGADDVTQRYARTVVDLTLRLGDALLSTGASASDVVTTMLRVAGAYGLGSAHVDITHTSITIAVPRGLDEDPLSVMRVVRVRAADYSRLEALHAFVRQITGTGIEVDEARSQLAEILRAPHPYRRWLVTVALAIMGAGVVGLFGGGPLVIALAALTTAVIDRVQRWLSLRGVATFFTQAIGAALATTVAATVYYANQHGQQLPGLHSPSLVVVAGIIVLLAGLSVVGTAQDAIDGYYVTASGRAFEVLMLTMGIVVGVGVVLAAAQRLGIQMRVSPYVALGSDAIGTTVAAVVTAGAFAVSAYTGIRATVLAAGVGGLGWVAFLAADPLDLGLPTRSAIAAVVVGCLAQLLARRLRVPALALTTAGIIALLPGLSVYRGLFYLLEGSPDLVDDGLTSLVTAAGIGLGLAAGITAGGYLARSWFAEPELQSQRMQRALRRAVGDAHD